MHHMNQYQTWFHLVPTQNPLNLRAKRIEPWKLHPRIPHTRRILSIPSRNSVADPIKLTTTRPASPIP
jgi:hypothetical protein